MVDEASSRNDLAVEGQRGKQAEGKRVMRGVYAFIVGFIAGTAPFIFMYCLPILLTPGSREVSPPLFQLLLTGTIVGAITTIMFTGQIRKTWQDVFVYALGIPALLIATVGDISSRLSARELQARTSSAIMAPEVSTPAIESDLEIIDVESLMEKYDETSSLINRLFRSDAVAATPDTLRAEKLEKGQYLIVIGSYGDKKSALQAFRKFRDTRLNTEDYINKSLELLKKTDRYLIVYWRCSNEEAALKAYKLMRVNDPKIPVQIFKY